VKRTPRSKQSAMPKEAISRREGYLIKRRRSHRSLRSPNPEQMTRNGYERYPKRNGTGTSTNGQPQRASIAVTMHKPLFSISNIVSPHQPGKPTSGIVFVYVADEQKNLREEEHYACFCFPTDEFPKMMYRNLSRGGSDTYQWLCCQTFKQFGVDQGKIRHISSHLPASSRAERDLAQAHAHY